MSYKDLSRNLVGSSPTGGTKYLYDERVDMRALETRAERRVGANPTTGTKLKLKYGS